MKKLLLLFVAISALTVSNAQTPKTDSLQEYTGKYKFPDGSVVSEVNIVLENGVLSATSVMGNSELKRVEGDIFEVIAYGGKATFKRSPEGKVNGVKIEVDDIILEGPKSETPALDTDFNTYFIHQSLYSSRFTNR